MATSLARILHTSMKTVSRPRAVTFARSASSLYPAPLPSTTTPLLPNQQPVVEPTTPEQVEQMRGPPARPARPAPRIKASKAALTLTPDAVNRLRGLLSGPTPQLIRIGVRNKGCAGMQYNLEYVEKPGKFDEVVSQDGVQVFIDSKALFSIIGSEMHWSEDRLSSKFVFKNPNIVDSCGCGESFNVAV